MGADGGPAVSVTAQNLRKSYRLGEHQSLGLTVRRLVRRADNLPRFEALAGVDFECLRGEALGIVGTNGSGKSTLLQILAGTTLPTDGEMRVRGHVIPLLSVGQGFHPELTGTENVTLFASSLRIPRDIIRERMDDVTAFADLGQHMDTPVKRFSSGMISRLSFAIAMQFPADIYVLDEVLAVVDGEFQARCLEAIKGLRDAGSTVFFVSHNLDQVSEVCDRVMWLERGTVRKIGPVGAVLDAYQHVLVPDSH
ncbi:MAG: lipopolysaccharide transport system ATP-binding protein [Frankiaceae bacterium]|jgi:ABC-type polysaccharide/polyol phosphate transport system ATPase subunit|nr:lipopolysaccharide transport system ATP-binding protein [Frankiaceae bacterium]